MDPWKLEPARDLGLTAAERWKSIRREAGLGELLLQSLWWGAVRGFLATYHRLSVRGREHLPAQPPFVMIANHASHLDAMCLAASLPPRLRRAAFPVAAGDTFFESTRSAAFAAIALNALPLWRRNCGRHALRELRERLVSEPCTLILFPEGTRSRSGELGSFKPGLGMLIAGTKIPVVPCHIRGAFHAWPPTSRFARPRRIHLRIGQPLAFAHTPDGRDGWDEITRRCEAAVRELSP